MKLIERYVDEIEPGDIVVMGGHFYPVMSIKCDIHGSVEFELCCSVDESGEYGTCYEVTLLVNDTMFVAIDDEEDEDEQEL